MNDAAHVRPVCCAMPILRLHCRALTRAWALLAIATALACGSTADAPPRDARVGGIAHDARVARAPRSAQREGIGFRTHAQEAQHFQKHGAEFGNVSEREYVRLAQALRDAPLGGPIEEIRRPDGTISRFDGASGAFLAYDSDGTIRTFFKPNTGESYFRRQALRTH